MVSSYDTFTPTLVQAARFVSASEEAVLHGEKALTPIIAGSISGILVAILWTLGLLSYLNKRREEREFDQEVAAGLRDPKELIKYKIPPDPAVIAGDHEAGEHIKMIKQKKMFHPTKHVPDLSPTAENVTSTGNAPLQRGTLLPTLTERSLHNGHVDE